MIGDMDTVQLLLDKGENPNIPDPSGDTALIHAAHNGHADVVRLLLECGADPCYVEEKYPRTALAEAADEGHSDVVALFLDPALTNFSVTDRAPLEKTGERHMNARLCGIIVGARQGHQRARPARRRAIDYDINPSIVLICSPATTRRC